MGCGNADGPPKEISSAPVGGASTGTATIAPKTPKIATSLPDANAAPSSAPAAKKKEGAKPAPSAVAAVIDASSAAYGSSSRIKAHVTLDATINGDHKLEKYDIATDGRTALIRIRKPERAEEAASDRSFYFGSDKLTAYDSVANERLSRPLPKNKSLLDRVVFILGQQDDMIKNLLQPSGMKEFLKSMRGLSGWNDEADPDGPVLINATTAGSTTLAFEGDRKRLRRVDVLAGKNQIHWTFAYGAGGPEPLTTPASARLVGAFTVSLIPPNYRTPEAKQVVDKMLEAYRRLTDGEIRIETDDGPVQVFLSGRKLREIQSQVDYAYDGSRLTIANRQTNKFYAGSAVRRTVPDYVALVGGHIDPISRQILQRKVPFREVFAPRVKVSLSGEFGSGDSACDILKVEYPGGRTSMFVRKSDHLLDSVSTDTLGDDGHVLTSSARRFKYAMLGQSQPIGSFVVSRHGGQPICRCPP